MKIAIFCGSIAVVAGIAHAAAVVPEATNVAVVQRGCNGVSVTYDLEGCDGIVTVDFLTNGVSVGRENITGLSGDVCKVITAGKGKSLLWKPAKSWPDSQMVKSAVLTAELTVRAVNTPPDYLVIDFDAPKDHRYYETAAEVPGGVTNVMYKTSKMVFRRIPAANVTFPMGSPSSEVGRQDAAWQDDDCFFIGVEDIHMVSFTNDFYLGIYELTQEQSRRVDNRQTVKGKFTEGEDAPMRPQDTIARSYVFGRYSCPDTYTDRWSPHSGSFLARFTAMTGIAKCSLPTEAEWEFACRAGVPSAFYWGGELVKDESGAYSNAEMDDYVWHSGNSQGTTHPVGLKKPNAWGLYDMLGNVTELTMDRTRSWRYNKKPPYPKELNSTTVLQTIDPLMDNANAGATDWNDAAPLRGGSYWEPVTHCRSASRTVQRMKWSLPDAPNDGAHFGCRLAIRLD